MHVCNFDWTDPLDGIEQEPPATTIIITVRRHM